MKYKYNKYRPPIQERLANWLFSKKAFLRKNKYKTDIIFPPHEYTEVFRDEFNHKLTDNWRLAQSWGEFHPRYLNQYYDTTGDLAYLTSNHGLALELRNYPKTFIRKNLPQWQQDSWNLPPEFTIPTAIGLVVSKQAWQYGWFEAWIKLPEGAPYWPAFWLSGANFWPPEIDIFEGYSRHGSRYDGYWLFDRLFKRKDTCIQPNIHFGADKKNHQMYGAYNVPVHKLTRRYVQYVCHWEKDFIKIYYDGKLALKTTDPKVLQWFNNENNKMEIILNHGRIGMETTPNESAMLVKSVTIYQK